MKKLMNNPIFVTVLALISIVIVVMNIRNAISGDSDFEDNYQEVVEDDFDTYDEFSDEPGAYDEESGAPSKARGTTSNLGDSRWSISESRNPFRLGRTKIPAKVIIPEPETVVQNKKKRVKRYSSVKKKESIKAIIDTKIEAIIRGTAEDIVRINGREYAIGDTYRGGSISKIAHNHIVVTDKKERKVNYLIGSLDGTK